MNSQVGGEREIPATVFPQLNSGFKHLEEENWKLKHMVPELSG